MTAIERLLTYICTFTGASIFLALKWGFVYAGRQFCSSELQVKMNRQKIGTRLDLLNHAQKSLGMKIKFTYR